MISQFKEFLFEVRFGDVFKSDNEYINSFKKDFDENGNFIRFVSVRIDNIRQRFEINYNHNENHDIKKRINTRTTLKNIEEFNSLFKCALIEFFKTHSNDGSYSLFLKEYNFSVILSISTNKIFVKTVSIGLDSSNINDVVEINCVL